MSDSSSANREYKKNQLRSRMITTGQPNRESQASDISGHEKSTPRLTSLGPDRPSQRVTARSQAEEASRQRAESTETIRRAHNRVIRRRAVIITVLFCLVAGVLGGLYWYNRFVKLENTTVMWERRMEQTEGTFTGYVSFGENVLKYTRDGASYIDGSGKDIWIQSYEMNNPIVAVCGNYAAIADQQGNSIYICDQTGCLGIATTVLPISRVSISSQGMVAAVVEDQTSSNVYYFQRDGSELEIYIKGLLSSADSQDDMGIGYVLDADLSPDGNVLMGSYFYIQGGSLRNRVAFYNFSEVGKNAVNRMVGGFHEIYEDSMVAKVVCLNDTCAVAFADNSLSFYSLRDEMSPEMIRLIPVEEEIHSIFYNEDYVGIVVYDISGENEYRMDVYHSDGSEAFSEEFNYDYTQVDVEGDTVILYNEDSCRLYNHYGNLKYEGNFDFTIAKITVGKLPNQIIVTGPQIMQEILLH